MDSMQMVDPYGALPNVSLDGVLIDDTGALMGDRAPRLKRINVEKFEPLAPGERRTISFSLNPLSLFTSGYLLPLMHASISVEFCSLPRRKMSWSATSPPNWGQTSFDGAGVSGGRLMSRS